MTQEPDGQNSWAETSQQIATPGSTKGQQFGNFGSGIGGQILANTIYSASKSLFGWIGFQPITLHLRATCWWTENVVSKTLCAAFGLNIAVGAIAASAEEAIGRRHTGDVEWCRSNGADWIIAGMDNNAELRKEDWSTHPMGDRSSAFEYFDSERVVRAENVTDGYVFCFSTVNGMCKPEFPSHACHAMITMRDGRHVAGTFFLVPNQVVRNGRLVQTEFMMFESDQNRTTNGRTVPLPVPSAPVAADYCRGFSVDACEPMKAQVATGTSPAYCKPGFAIVGSPANVGLTNEQLRICYVTSSFKK
jgi:hypothetical protein